MGTALTADQARLLARYADEVVVAYDDDEAGESAYRRALPLLLRVGLGVRRARFGAGHDPDSLRLSAGGEAVLEAVDTAPDAVLLELERVISPQVHRDPRGQSRAAGQVAELLRPVRDEVLRYSYARGAADRLGIPVELLWRRTGGEGRAEEEGSPAPSGAAGLVRSLEEKVLQLVLSESEELPSAEELPPAEVFLDRVCRNIYRAFRDLYRDRPERRPAARQVLSELAGDGSEVDRAAQLLLEEPSARSAGELGRCLDQLIRRWRQRRLRELASEINQAQRQGDQGRLESLLREKTELSLALHRPGGGRARGDEV